jgi:hypothetical protein
MYNNARISLLLGRESVYRINRALASVRPGELHYGESETRAHTHPAIRGAFSFQPRIWETNWILGSFVDECIHACKLSRSLNTLIAPPSHLPLLLRSCMVIPGLLLRPLHTREWLLNFFNPGPDSLAQPRFASVAVPADAIRSCSENAILFLVQSLTQLFLESQKRCVLRIYTHGSLDAINNKPQW